MALIRTFELVESKLLPPSPRPGIVRRTALVDRLLAADAVPIILVVAPAGYGKTTLLAQWAERKAPRVGWVSVDQAYNDPAVLLAYIATAVDRVEPIDPGILQTVAAPAFSAAATLVPQITAAVAAMTQPVALVLDHVELLANVQSLDAVAELAVQLPSGSQLALGSRARPPLPEGLLRAQGRMAEVGVKELAMDRLEARALLEGTGVRLAEAEVAELVGRTEGWARGAVPRGDDPQIGRPPQRRLGPVRRQRPPGRQLPARAATCPAATADGVVPEAHGGARPIERAAVRRGPGDHRVGRRAGVAGGFQPAGRPAGPPPRVVPLPPAVPRAARC
jgi:hypothetical protein